MIKPISQLLREAYYNYYKERGIPPTKFSVGIEYRDEWYNSVFSNIVIYNTSVLNGDKDSYMNIPIQWINRRRIECLPRRRFTTLASSLVRVKPMPDMPSGQVFYPDLTNP